MASVKLIIHAFLANVLVLNNPAKMTRMPGNNCQVLCRRDDRVPPKANLEGHARRARRSGMDNPIWGGGRDKRVPPRRGLTSRSLGKVVCGSIAPRPRDLPTTRRRHPLDLSEVGSEAKGTSLRKKLSFDACSGRPGEALCFGQQSWANPVFW